MSWETIREIITDAGWGTLATLSEDGSPRLRPMAFVLDEGVLLSSTWNVSGKVAEMKGDERVEVCFLASGGRQLRISGRADLSGGPTEKARLLELNPRIRKHFADENVPHFVHIAIHPTHIRWKGPGFSEYEELSL